MSARSTTSTDQEIDHEIDQESGESQLRLLPGESSSLLRQLAFALAMALFLIAYFELRIKALSPAIAEIEGRLL